MSLIVGYNPGGSYDVYSRLAAQLLPKYLPGNPTIAVKNMPGVASVKAANYLFQQAPKDGLTIGMVGQQLALTQALRDPAVAYDMRKFGWLGRFTPIIEVSLTWHTSPTKTINDAMQRETVMAATSAGATTEIMPSMMNKLAGTRFKIVKGYPGTTGTILAMERGETEGAHATLENLLFGKPHMAAREDRQRAGAICAAAASAVCRRAGDGRVRQDLRGQAGAQPVRQHRRSRPRADDAAGCSRPSGLRCCAARSPRCSPIPPSRRRWTSATWNSARCRATICKS